MSNYRELYQESILAYIAGHRQLLEKILGERILSFGEDKYTEGAYVRTTDDTYWFGWDWNIGGDITFNNWGNGVEGFISENGKYTIERYDA